MNIAAAILAGGRARRMGGVEKGLLALGGETLVARIVARIAPQVMRLPGAGPALAINAANEERYRAFGLPLLADDFPGGRGPLAGLLAALPWAAKLEAAALLAVPCDTPFLPRDLVERLAEAGPCAIATTPGRRHFACGLWPVDLAPTLRAAIEGEGLARLEDWALRRKANVVEWPDRPYDPFHNINTPADMTEALRILREFDP